MLQPGQTFDRYTVETLLGEGGMASVYRVRHTTLGSLHALKILHVDHPAVGERLLAEGRVQAGLDHPHALVVTDVITVDGMPGLVMEYVDGGSLEDWVDTGPTRAERLAVFRGACEAVAAAHAAGWIHRDLKPANILLKRVDGTVVPKVADFGLVKALTGARPHAGPQTRDGSTMGTPGYMAPEQIENAAEVDARADVYSLGCVLVWTLTGRPAFAGDSVVDLFGAVASGSFDGLPPDDPLAPVVDRCLARDPDQRYADAGALLAALDTPDARSTRPARAPTAALWAALAGVLLLGGLALGGVTLVAATAFIGAVDEVVPSVPSSDCPTTGRIGWVPGYLPRMTPIPRPLVLDEPVEVHVEASRTSEVVCTLPAGSSLDWSDRVRTLRGSYWVIVDAEDTTLP
jgi:hypothetical protein